jgi:NitT/TauT family transport system ATP-binding protein
MMRTLHIRNLLRLEHVSKAYDSRVILDDIELAVGSKEFCVIVGPSGCGKSTLLRIILGQERPTSGRVFLEGNPAGYADIDRGIVYQKYSLFPHLSVLDNILLGKNLQVGFWERYRRRKEFRDEAIHYLERVGLVDHRDKYPHELSGGMQQRVAIVQSLIAKPKILLMDEPFGALDPGVREDMQRFILKLWKDSDMTLFFVTHDLKEAYFLGTRLLVLSQFYPKTKDQGEQATQGSRIVADYLVTHMKGYLGFKKFVADIRKEMYKTKEMYKVKDDLTMESAELDEF